MAAKNITLRVGLAGFGNVGAGVYKNLVKNADLLRARIGHTLEITRIALRDPNKKRDFTPPADLVTTRPEDIIEDENIDIVVELMGGVDRAYDFASAALEAKKPVITGNKALLAERGMELISLAEKENVPLYFEAAVAGGIPIIKTVGEALVANRIESIHGIINGTCNYILTQMKDAGISYTEALNEAQNLGYAEADPTLDINGWDAAHKAIILAWLSYGRWLKPDDIHVEGVESIRRIDISFAAQLGYHIKLVAVIRQAKDKRIEVRVQPSLLPKAHILANVNGVYNALALRGDVVGETLFYGSGAGQDATSSSVIADLADVANNVAADIGYDGFLPHGEYGQAVPLDDTISEYYLRLQVVDTPGAVAAVTAALGNRKIGIRSAIQPEPQSATREASPTATLVLTTHETTHGNMHAAVEEIQALDCIEPPPTLHRIETL
ncbi:MAG: homoserine dehydrogenase [Verrucomicrobiota bacterium]